MPPPDLPDLDTILLRLADLNEAPVRQSYLNMVADLRTAFPERDIAETVAAGDVTGTYRLIQDLVEARRLRAGSQLESTLLRSVVNQRKALTDDFQAAQGISLQYRNDLAERWASTEAARLVTGVTPTQQAAIRQLIMAGPDTPLRPAEVSRMIRNHIGLLPAHQQAVATYSLDLWRKELAGAAPTTLPPRRLDLISRRVERHSTTYSNRLLAWRADMIARTEAIRAGNIGQLLVWQAQHEKGIIGDTAQVVWVVTDDDRLCPLCAPMEDQAVALVAILEVLDIVEEAGWDPALDFNLRSGPSITSGLFLSTHKGFPDGLPRPGRHRVLKPDPFSNTRKQLSRTIAASVAGKPPLIPRDYPTSHLAPPLHPQCRCRLTLRL